MAEDTKVIELDGETRLLLRQEILMASTSLEGLQGHVFRDGERSRAVGLCELAQDLVRRMDEIDGWDLDLDETVPDALKVSVERQAWLAWMFELRHGFESDIGMNTVILSRQEQGDPDHYWSGHDQAESIELSRQYIQRDLARVDRLQELILQLRTRETAVA